MNIGRKGIFFANAYKSAKSLSWVVAILLVAFSLLQTILNNLVTGDTANVLENVMDALQLTSSFGAMREMECLAYALIASLSYLIERRSGYIRFALQRAGRRRYLMGCLVSVSLNAIFVALIGLMLFVAVLMAGFGLPMFADKGQETVSYGFISGSDLLRGNAPYLIWITIGFSFALSSATWALGALAVSACTDNMFVVALSPMVFSYLMNAVSIVLHEISLTPAYLVDYYYLGRGVTPLADPLYAMGVTLAWYLPIIMLACIVFWISASRRIRNDQCA